MSSRDELILIAVAMALLAAGALLGATTAFIARANGTPTTSAALGGCVVGEPCPVSP